MRRFLKAALVLLATATADCVSSPTAGLSQAITGGTPHSGHPEVAQFQVGGVTVCTGIVVGKRIALTSAHCTASSDMSLRFDGGQVLKVASATIHPGYTKIGAGFSEPFDLAVLALEQDAPVKPAEVSTVAPVAGLAISIIGYGATSCEALSDAGFGKDAAVKCSDDQGTKRLATATISELFQHELSIEGKANACRGDSGGPVLATLAGRELTLSTIARGKLPCGTRSYATRLDSLFTWMDSVAKGDINADRRPLSDSGMEAPGWGPSGGARTDIRPPPADVGSLGGGCVAAGAPPRFQPWLMLLVALLFGGGLAIREVQ